MILANLTVNVVLEGALDVMHDVSLNCILVMTLNVHPLCTIVPMLKETRAAATAFVN
jgi:hypothetical protein